MKLYLIRQDIVNDFDTYDSAVVAAESPEDARKIHPSKFVTHITNDMWHGTYVGGGEYENESSGWVKYSDIGQVQTEYLGETEIYRGVVLASFNAG